MKHASPIALLWLLLLLGGAGWAHSGALTLTITIPDDVLTAVREVYSTQGQPATDARLATIFGQEILARMDQLAAQQVQSDAQRLVDAWQRGDRIQRQQILEGLRAVLPRAP